MGIIYKNSVQYSGMIAEKGGSDDRELTQAEYDALSEAEKMNGTTYYITDASNRQNDVYSTTEQAIGTWIDGKTIYRKTIDFGTLPNSTTKSVAHGISGISQVIKISGTAVSGGTYFPLPHASTAAASSIEITVTGTNIVIGAGQDRRGLTAVVTLEYTK